MLNDVARRDLVPLLCRQAEILADEADLLDLLGAEIDATNAKELAKAPAPLARRALRRWLSGFLEGHYPPNAAAVERVLAVARGQVRATEVEGGLRISRSKGVLRPHS